MSTTVQQPLQSMGDMPAAPPPPGVSPNYGGGGGTGSNGNDLALAVTSICLVASTLAIFVRFFFVLVKGKSRSVKLCVPELFVLAGYAIFLGYVSMYYMNTIQNGAWRHIFELSMQGLTETLYMTYINYNLYLAAALALKIAIPLNLSFSSSPKSLSTTCYAILGLNAAYLSSSIVATNLMCRPIRMAWDPTSQGTCFDAATFMICAAALHVASNVALFILSVTSPQVLPEEEEKTSTTSGNRSIGRIIGSIGLIVLGLFAIASSAARLAVQITPSFDVTYDWAPIPLWDMAELTCGFLVFCLLGFRRRQLSSPVSEEQQQDQAVPVSSQ